MKVLARRVLVLNKSWVPCQVITVRKAMQLLTSEYKNGEPKARIVDPTQGYQQFEWEEWMLLEPVDGQPCIHSARRGFRVPKVIVLTRQQKHTKITVKYNRRNVFQRDNYECQYCGRKVSTQERSVDHVEPKATGGKTCFENCVTACVTCNRRKGCRTLKKAGMRLLKAPTVPKPMVETVADWTQHLEKLLATG